MEVKYSIIIGEGVKLELLPNYDIDNYVDACSVVQFIETVLPVSTSIRVIDMLLEKYSAKEDLEEEE